MKVLILSCNTGGGHNSCARAIGTELQRRGHTYETDDALLYVSKGTSRFVSNWHVRFYRYFPKLMPAKKIPARPDEQTLLVMIRETCAAEATHTLLMLAGLGVIVIWPCVWGVMLYLVYAILGNLIFIIIQRYNRPRLVRLYERKRAKRSKEA